jgi:hypothetical protein
VAAIGPNDLVVAQVGGDEASPSAVSWAAVIAGAVVAAAASLIMVALGSGLGFAAASPWPSAAASAATFGVMTGLWLILTQWLASGVGGYLAGRLRTRWAGTHVHEVFFRDTAHGFLTWALATLMVATLVAVAATVTAGATATGAGGPVAYQTDVLLRSTNSEAAASAPAIHAEVARTLSRAATPTGLAGDDRSYLASLVAGRTGLALEQAVARVDSAVIAVRKSADEARKAASATSFFTALAMVIGAFIASVAAALGGQQRDEHP